jgi:hypothetical protein
MASAATPCYHGPDGPATRSPGACTCLAPIARRRRWPAAGPAVAGPCLRHAAGAQRPTRPDPRCGASAASGFNLRVLDGRRPSAVVARRDQHAAGRRRRCCSALLSAAPCEPPDDRRSWSRGASASLGAARASRQTPDCTRSFHVLRSEHELLRYIQRLAGEGPVAACTSMIPLGSLHDEAQRGRGAVAGDAGPASASCIPSRRSTRPRATSSLFGDLERWLAAITGFAGVLAAAQRRLARASTPACWSIRAWHRTPRRGAPPHLPDPDQRPRHQPGHAP